MTASVKISEIVNRLISLMTDSPVYVLVLSTSLQE